MQHSMIFPTPVLVSSIAGANIAIVSSACGATHTLLLTDQVRVKNPIPVAGAVHSIDNGQYRGTCTLVEPIFMANLVLAPQQLSRMCHAKLNISNPRLLHP